MAFKRVIIWRVGPLSWLLEPTKAMLRVLLLLIPLFMLHAIKRKREIDRHGNPNLRFYGPALSAFTIGLLSLFITYRPLLGMNPWVATSDASIMLFFAGLGFFASILFFFSKTVLTDTSVITNYIFVKFNYELKDFERIEDERYVLLHFTANRKVAILPFCSGQQYFIERLLALTTQSRGPPWKH